MEDFLTTSSALQRHFGAARCNPPNGCGPGGRRHLFSARDAGVRPGRGIVPHSDTPMGLQVITWVAITLALALVADGVVSLVRERPGLQVGRRRTMRWRPLA